MNRTAKILRKCSDSKDSSFEILLKKKISGKVKPLRKPHLNDYLNISYSLARSVRYEQFLVALGVQHKVIKETVKIRPTVTLSEEKNDGVEGEVYRERSGGERIKSDFKIRGNRVIEKQNLNGKQVIIERKFGENDLVVTMKTSKVECQRFYVSVFESKHTINTETSRRQSFTRQHDSAALTEILPEETLVEEIKMEEIDSEEICY
ncbi:fatty acid-binding protein, putative [Pediculus humanus corporis]|uniref:Fatty acid-binding protein, putative n=1 Tax=Pediculus humanus subsp. corporis TaxID=121224 RepID=E0VCP6_PEDHC|nr:fatty acid-binding protein, putative [Pediculus humanus corporis]EEB11152.1 fatty acid-binding protein, putative [Pediculus humanus corporis]